MECVNEIGHLGSEEDEVINILYYVADVSSLGTTAGSHKRAARMVLFFGEPVGVPVVDVRQDVIDDGVPLGAGVVDGGQLAAVVSRQV